LSAEFLLKQMKILTTTKIQHQPGTGKEGFVGEGVFLPTVHSRINGPDSQSAPSLKLEEV